jgi:hypothetical protein
MQEVTPRLYVPITPRNKVGDPRSVSAAWKRAPRCALPEPACALSTAAYSSALGLAASALMAWRSPGTRRRMAVSCAFAARCARINTPMK